MRQPITGLYPGGPSERSGALTTGTLPSVADLALMEATARARRKARTRRGRVILVLVVALLGAAGTGYGLGRAERKSRAELVSPAGSRTIDPAVREEVNRMLLELWKMEDTEPGRNRPLRY